MRLRPEFASFYPGLDPMVWETATDLAARFLAQHKLQPSPGYMLSNRILSEQHFEFQGGNPTRGFEKALCDAVADSTEDYRTWLTESDARLQSGRSVEWLRAQFPRWLDQGLARLNGRKREYRAMIVPRRANVSAAKEAGRRAASEQGAA